jgi:CheY-like chemotaxis protein
MPSEDLKDLTIVLVEDHSDARTLISSFLRQKGATVIPAANGIEGLEAVKTHRPNVVLSDLVMSGRNGFELLSDIRALGKNDGGNVPVIAMTALVRYPDHQQSPTTGFQSHISKPFSPQQLLNTILAVLRE